MSTQFNLSFFIFLLFLTSCTTTKIEKTDYKRAIRNKTFSDIHRNPKVVANEYFEFKSSNFSYNLARKEFGDQYFRRTSYQGSYVVLNDNTLLLHIQKMLFCDKEVVGQNKPSKKSKTADPEAENRCTYSYYDIEVLKAKKLIDHHKFDMPTKFKIVKTANATKIVALNRSEGKVYGAKKPSTY